MKKENDNVYTILFVCSGNACRSPMAEGLLKKKLFPEYGAQIKIHSAGTLGINDSPATPNAVTVAKEKGIDISGHLSKGITEEMLAEADLVLVMAEHHKQFLDEYFPDNKNKFSLLTVFAAEDKTLEDTSIKDPIGENLTVYRKVINHIDREINRIIPQLKTLIDQKLKQR